MNVVMTNERTTFMTVQERKRYRIACILYESMRSKSSAMVCDKYKISLDKLMRYEERYSTMWVLKTYQEAKEIGFIEDNNRLDDYIE